MKKYIIGALIVLAILLAAFFTLVPFLVRSEYLEQIIRKTLEEKLAYSPSFEKLRVSFFPTPVLSIGNLELTPLEGNLNSPLVRAESAKFRPSILSLLIGRPTLAHAIIKDADIHYTLRGDDFVKTISLNDATLTLSNFGPNRSIRFKLKGKFLSDSENIQLSGSLKSDFETFKTKDFSSKSQINIGPMELLRLQEWWGLPLPFHADQGTFSFSGQINKAEGSNNLELNGSTELKQLVYQVPGKSGSSTSADYTLTFQTDFDLNSGLFEVKNGELTAPFGGPFEIHGKGNFLEPSIDEIMVKASSLRVDMFPQYLLSLQEVIPVNLGFSGETQLDFYARGEAELFDVDFNLDLTKTTLSYSKYFSKPAGIPLSFKSDMKLAAGRVLRGDFSLDFEEASLKGSLVGLDLVSGVGELTILTNKFSIGGWQQYSPLLREFELSGFIKILTSIKGNFRQLNEAQFMNNVTLEGIEAISKTGTAIKNLNGSVDLGPMDSEFKGVYFEIGNTPFSVEGKMFQRPAPNLLVNIASPKIDAVDMVSQVSGIFRAIQTENSKVDLTPVENSVKQVFGTTEFIEQFNAQFAFGEGKILMPQLQFSAFGGSISLRGSYDYIQPMMVLETNIQRLNLSRMQSGSSQSVMDGNLFSFFTLSNNAPLGPEWAAQLKGNGSISITNGELHTIDILGGLGQIAQLTQLESFKSGVTRFDDIRGDFFIADSKLTTENSLLVSEDFQIEAQGDVGFDGNLNFRLSVFLSPALSQRISGNVPEGQRLGPIPVLITGPIGQPSISQNPLLMTGFLQSLVQGQFLRIASQFSPRPQQPVNPGQVDPNDPNAGQGSQTQQSQNMQDQFMQSGASLLEHFLSQKKSSS